MQSSSGQGFIECAVFLDLNLEGVAAAQSPTALVITMGGSNGFLYQSIMLGLEKNDITPFMIALKQAQENGEEAVRSIRRNTWFTVTQNGASIMVQPSGANISGGTPMNLVYGSLWNFHFDKGWDRYVLYQ